MMGSVKINREREKKRKSDSPRRLSDEDEQLAESSESAGCLSFEAACPSCNTAQLQHGPHLFTRAMRGNHSALIYYLHYFHCVVLMQTLHRANHFT